MLLELSIKNFAIIKEESISFEDGLTVLTGETGAGKSIIIDAIQLLVGGRGSAEFIRHGEEKAELEGYFQLSDSNHAALRAMREFGIDTAECTVVIRRDMSISGKSVCRINGKMVTISILREVGRKLVDIHGQHEHQELMDSDIHLSLLDQYGGQEIEQSLKEYRKMYKTYAEIKSQIQKLSENEQQMAHRLDLVQFQWDEIQKAELLPYEEEQLLDEKRKLNNYERVHQSLHNAYVSLNGENKGMDWIGNAMSEIEIIEDLDEPYKKLAETVRNSFYLIEDAVSTIHSHLDMLEFEPERLNEVESRITEINHLKRKYGKSITEILEYGATIEEEIETIQNRESHIEDLQKRLKALQTDLALEGENLTQLRKKYAKKLTNAIHIELKELYMEKAVFEVRLSSKPFSIDGADSGEFYISTNPGEPLKSLVKTASGGELSRIMLALKNIFSKHQGTTSIIFDEVDTGVSGRVAQAIAEKIYRVSIGSQVLCISHLPQVASMADHHLLIVKHTSKGRTETKVEQIDKEESIKEIARMISGKELTSVTKDHAREMLQQAEQIKIQ